MERAAREFGVDKETISKRVTAQGIIAGKDRCFSTAEICAAVFGDIESEKLRSERHKANLLEMDEMERKGVLIQRQTVNEWIDKAGETLKMNIMASNLADEEKREFLKAFQDNLAKI